MLALFAVIVTCIAGWALIKRYQTHMVLLFAGLAIFLFFGCKAVTKGAVALTKKTVLGAKRRICNG